MTIFVSNNNKCCETETTSTFNYFSNTVDCNNAFF
ncbi:30S ribosomal protein S5 [Listeria monocytogenes]|nr:30S ribosomal protein S5 [Listeria monocytogenes]GAT41864.1 30S ribosomal protein S5 [Listeria monocytogenes]